MITILFSILLKREVKVRLLKHPKKKWLVEFLGNDNRQAKPSTTVEQANVVEARTRHIDRPVSSSAATFQSGVHKKKFLAKTFTGVKFKHVAKGIVIFDEPNSKRVQHISFIISAKVW